MNKSCCCCDTYDEYGKLIDHIEHDILYKCTNKGCKHYCCEKHRETCGFCMGCCAEIHEFNHGEE